MSAANAKTILFVDDDQNVQRLLAKIAEKFNFKLLQAFDGKQALELLGKEKIDLILLDIMMPHLDGRDVCRTIKADDETRHIPVIIFSAKDQQSDRLLGFELGADDYITKPFHLEVLMRKIEYFLEDKPRGEGKNPL